MANHLAGRWKQRGATYLWRYKTRRRNYPGWNFNADADGCASLIAMIDLMLGSEWSATQDVELQPLSDRIAGLTGAAAPWRAASMLSIKYPGSTAPPTYWECSDDPTSPVLVVGLSKLIELRSAIVDVSQFKGDFCIYAEDLPAHEVDPQRLPIWFW